MSHQPIYIVITSNCEPYEEYAESIDGAFSTREAAVAYIEGQLGMHQVTFASPDMPHRRDRWLIEIPHLPTLEDFDGDEQAFDYECRDEFGNIIPYWVDRTDAHIQVLNLDEHVPCEK